MTGAARARRRAAGLALTAVLCTACAASSADTTEAGSPRGSPNALSGDELRETQATNLWDALRRLRPQWLRPRATTSFVAPQAEEPVVYLYGIRHGPIRTLQQMNVDQVRSVEYIDGRDATTRFGTGHGGGVIMVDLDRN